MKYPSGEDARLGDTVSLGDRDQGVVVCSPDTNEFSERFPRSEWGSLEKGILVEFNKLGLIHYMFPEPTLVLLGRSRNDQ